MSKIRDYVKDIVRDTITDRRSSGMLGRIGTVANVNDDGSIDVSIDGTNVNCTTSYTLTQGMQVLVMSTDGGTRTAVPTRPITQPDAIVAPQFFSGGFMRFANGLYIQEAGDSKVYLLDTSDWPVGISPVITSFSPNGKRIAVFGMNSSSISPLSMYRMYDIGQSLTSTGEIDPVHQIFGLKATLLISTTRPINNTFTPVTPNPIFRPNPPVVDNDTIFWSEFIFANRSLGAGEANETVALMGVDSGQNPITIAQTVIEFVSPAGPPLNAQFVEIVNFITIFNGTKQEMLMKQTKPFGSGNLLATSGPFVPGTFPNLGVEIPATSYTAAVTGQTISPGCAQKFVSSNFFSLGQNYAQTVKSKTVLYQGAVSNPSSPEDFLRALVETADGTVTEVQFTNSISGDASLGDRCFALLVSVTSGFVVDALGHIRPVSSSGGLLTISTDPTKYFKASPGEVDPTVLRIVADPFFSPGILLAAVSTL